MCDQYDETVDRLVSGCPAIVLLNIKADITESVSTPIRRFSYITNPHTIKARMNINPNLVLKQRTPQSFRILQYIQVEN